MNNALLSRFVAAVLLAFGFGFLAHQLDLAKLLRLDTLSLQANVDHERLLADHGYMHAVVVLAFIGVLYMFLVEVLSFVLRRGWRAPTAG